MEGEEELLKDARRLLAVNAGEQKRLEKLQRHIEKKRREKERMLTRAQEDAIAKFYENSREFLYTDKSQDKSRNLSVKAGATSDVVLKGHEISSETVTVREAKGKEREPVRHKKLSLQENSSRNFLPGLDLTVVGLRAQPFRRARTRSWSDLTSLCQLEELTNEGRKERGESISKEKQEEQKRKRAIQENEDQLTKEEKTEKPLSAILPPLVLPPVHQHRRQSLQEYSKNFYRTGSDQYYNGKSLKEQYDELSECRYLRLYQGKQNIQ